MKFEIRLDKENELIIVETTGRLSYEIFPEMIHKVISISEKTNFINGIINIENATIAPLSTNDIIKIAEDCRLMNEQFIKGKLAVVLVKDIDTGLGNMWKVYTGENLTYDTRIFRDVQEALKWVRLK
jgi:hypothetical protein